MPLQGMGRRFEIVRGYHIQAHHPMCEITSDHGVHRIGLLSFGLGRCAEHRVRRFDSVVLLNMVSWVSG